MFKKTRKYIKIMNIEINKEGFSKIWFTLKGQLLGNFEILDKFIPHPRVQRLFKKFRKNKSFFLIGKIAYANDEIKSLHRGIIVNKLQNNDYFSYIKNCLSEKDEYSLKEESNKLIFEFYEIKDKSKNKLLTNWNELKKELPNKSIKIVDNTPNNPDYKTWGNIIHDGKTYKIVLSLDSRYVFKVYSDYAEAYLNSTFVKRIEYFDSKKKLYKFF